MSQWPSSRGKQVLKALKDIGWSHDPADKKGGSHRKLVRENWPPYIWAFDDSDEIGPRMLARIAKKTGLTPQDL